MIFNSFQWYRRMIGGKWGKVTSPMFGGFKWVHVSDECSDRLDEYWVNLLTPTDDPKVSIKDLKENFAFHLGHNSDIWEHRKLLAEDLIDTIMDSLDEAVKES